MLIHVFFGDTVPRIGVGSFQERSRLIFSSLLNCLIYMICTT